MSAPDPAALVSRAELARFVEAIFRYADTDSFISLRVTGQRNS
jgi:hypothetical protein